MKRYTQTLFLFLFLILFTPSKAEEYSFRRYTNKNGLSHNTIPCSFQDSEGYMWIGTEEGLNRFDGYTFRVYKNHPLDIQTLPGNSIHSISEDSDGRLWICTGSGSCYFDKETEKFERNFIPFEDEYSPYFSSIIKDKDQNIWFTRRDLIVRFSLKDKTVKHFPAGDYFEGWNIALTEKGIPFFQITKVFISGKKRAILFQKHRF
ncbi:MAG: hypothetical protein LIP01_09180 [Tannerellaceae bacterium]|nr:hypothetical protein [Tannerellaceae bacterium]